MKTGIKSIMIKVIIDNLEAENKRKNATLCKENLFSQQKPFDRGEMFISLAFMPDEDFNRIANMICS